MRAFVIVDLGFGDSGKGLLTDYLTREYGAGIVVRYNGGAQAGHNVVAPDGRHHTFSQFGSGTFVPGVKTFLSHHVVIHPTALLLEGDRLTKLGVQDAFSRLRLSERALIITPFHQAANHIREMTRGVDRHGSCGVGVGEAVEDSLTGEGEVVLAGDLSNPPRLRRKLRSIRDRKREQLAALCKDAPPGSPIAREWQLIEREDVIERWISATARIGELGLVSPDSILRDWFHQAETAVFEGAQGVLLDADAGFHPYTTWSRCTPENADELIQATAPGAQVKKIGVLRSFAVRHGPGPLPTETDELKPFVQDHNQANEWQGSVRYGWFDAFLARYALSLTGKLDVLAITHMDLLARLNRWTYCSGYTGQLDLTDVPVTLTRAGEVLTGIRLPPSLSLEQRARFTQALFQVKPMLETCQPDEEHVIQAIEALLQQPVGLLSCGPKTENVQKLSRSNELL